MTSANINQFAFRSRDDDQALNSTTWTRGQGVDWTQIVDTTFRLRLGIEETNNKNATGFGQIEARYYSGSWGSWFDVTTSSTILRAVASTYSINDVAITPSQLTGSSRGTFDGGYGCEDGLASAIPFANAWEEFEYSLQIVSGDVSDGDLIEVRIQGCNTWADTPQITIDKSIYTPAQGIWRWYTDATPDGSMTGLANEDTKPTLTSAQMQNGIIRLRAQINETGGGSGSAQTIDLEYAEDTSQESYWQSVQAQTPTNDMEGVWFRWANGAATDGNTIGSQLLTGTTESGKYHESTTPTEDIGGSSKHEIDIALYVHWPPPDTTVNFRLVVGGTTLALDSGATAIQLQTSTAADRPYSITRLDWDDAQVVGREMRFGSWRRLFYDSVNGNWWFFTVQYFTPTILRSYYWTGTGAWTAGATFTCTNNMYQSRHALAFKVIGGVPTVIFHGGSSSSSRRVAKGTISGTTLTWGSEQTVTQNTDRHCHVGIDDGNYIWIAGTTASTGVWAIRSTNPNDVTAWQTVHTASDNQVNSGDVLTVVGLASDKAMILWASTGDDQIKYSIVTDSGGFGSVNSANATSVASNEDWGIARSGGYVYLAHSDSVSSGGNWVLRVFNESGESWTTGTSPSVSGQPSDNDGLPVIANGDEIYVFGTFANTEGGQDRKISYDVYTGPGDSGSWSGLSDLTPAASRGNGDHMSPGDVGGGNLMLAFEFGDDTIYGTGFVAEYFTLSVAQAQTANSSKHAFLAGHADANSSKHGYLIGSLDANSQKHAYLSGAANVSDSKDAFLHGQAEGSSTKHAYLEGTPPIQSASGSIHAFLQGSADASAITSAFLHGQSAATDLKHAYLQGVTGAVDNKSAYLKGQANISDSKQAYLYGVLVTSSSKHAYLAGQGESANSISAYLQGQDTDLDAVPAYILGSMEDSNVVSGYIFGAFIDSSTKSAYIQGEGYGGQVSDTRSAYMQGLDTDISTKSAYIGGQDYGQDTQPAYLQGVDSGVSLAHAYLAGTAQGQDTQTAYIHGQAFGDDVAYGYIRGQASLQDIQAAYIYGQVIVSDTKSAYVYGAAEEGQGVDQKPAYIAGIAQTSDSAPAFIAGGVVTQDSKSAYIFGQLGSQDVKQAFIHGSVPAQESIPAYMQGSSVFSDSRQAYVKGSLAFSDQRPAYLLGEESANSANSAFVRGALVELDTRSAYMDAVGAIVNTKHAYIYGYIEGGEPGVTELWTSLVEDVEIWDTISDENVVAWDTLVEDSEIDNDL